MTIKNKHAWNLSDLKKIKKNKKTVFSCFHCGGGSTMGYKLAGYDVLGGVEIDKKMMAIYKINHNPKYSYLMGIKEFNKIPNRELPKELFCLDILDGSPPCSSFSSCGRRDKDWSKEKKFREGQEKQILDTLFFDFIKTAKKLKPKIIVVENVKGIIQGKARGYVKEIIKRFEKIGYTVQIFLLDAAFMEVPQKRERIFFIAHKRKIKLKLHFNYKIIPLKDVFDFERMGKIAISKQFDMWKRCKQGYQFSSVHIKTSFFNYYKASKDKPSNTLVSSSDGGYFYWDEPLKFHKMEYIRIQSFPDDYNFLKNNVCYVCGMSVPPKMMMHISKEVYKQLLCK